MPRTRTTDLKAFQRPNVTYEFSTGPKAHIVTITVPPGSDWTSEPHWHHSHTEFLSVKKGTALVTLGSHTHSITPSDGPVTIERGMIHEWRRDSSDSGVLIVEEWTDPADGEKELFFRNLCSALLDMTASPSHAPSPSWLPFDWWISLQLFLVFREFDNYPLFYSGVTSRPVTYLILRVAQFVGLILGLRGHYNEYTPERARVKGKYD
ncbi:hypothetical protein MMC10_006665 [Thelotrema lepadinum]|nr:hypothetical protein [Thelotrema lepadinum]